MKKLALIFLLVFGFCGTAQETIKKTHYRIINENFESTLNYEKALAHTQLDELRYLDRRRQIPIEGTKIIIELFSAQELLMSYGKPISPLTVRKLDNFQVIKFKLAANNYSLLITPNAPTPEEHTNKPQKKVLVKDVITNFGGVLYDSGGKEGNYSNTESYTKTIYSDNGETPYLNFTSFSIENHFDVMYIYDGPNAESKLIGSYTGGNNPKIVKASGAYLTVVFVSDGSNTKSGWNAFIGKGTPPPPPSPMSAATCATGDPFCSGTNYSFPATTGGATAETGPNYGCLGSEPNPAWYYLQIANTGPLVLYVAGSAGDDVDFICWGPFTSPTAPCDTGLTGGCGFGTPTLTTNSPCSGNITDCSYSANATETCTINNAISGQYYMLLITNYSNQSQNIILNQLGGTGSTNCNIVNCGVSSTNTGPYCVGETINLNGATTNTTATTFSWSGPNSFSATGQNVTIPNSTLLMSGTYSVTGTTGGTVTCVATTTVAINANAPPTVTSATICAGSTGTLTASGATSYTWNTGATTASISDNPASTTVYTVTGATGTCTATATSTITTVSNPTVTVNSGTICSGNTTTLTAGGATNYTWTPNTGLTFTSNSVAIANPPTTTTYTVTGAIGVCTSSATTTVSVVSAIVPTVTSNTPCANQTLTLTCNPNTYTTYAWAGPNAYSSTVQNPIKTGVTAADAGTYTLFVTDANSCTNVATVNVVVNSLPIVTASATPACLNQTVNLSSTGGTSYSWSGPAGYTSAMQNPSIPNVSAGMAGLYIVTVTNANGCSNGNTVQVSVYPLPTILITSPPSLCISSSGTLAAAGAINYIWSPGTDLNSTFGSPVLLTPTTITNHDYTVTGQDANGCINTAITSITVNGVPAVSIAPDTTKGCTPQCVTYTVNAPTATKYSWNFGNGQIKTYTAPNNIATMCYTITGQYFAQLTLTDINGCVNTATANVITYPIPNPEFAYTPDPATILTPNIQFVNQSSGAIITSYNWNFGDGSGMSSALQNPNYTYADTGTYYVTLIDTSINGCIASIVQPVIIEPDFTLYVPNAFTPNGDGKNEIFKAQGDGILTFKMYIFDRWGNPVYTTSNIDIGWNGRRNNTGSETLQQDVYVWKIDLSSVNNIQGKTYTGIVTLLK